MAAEDRKTIYDEVCAYINRQGGTKSSWYVGIAADVEQRLHRDHKVPHNNHWFIHREAFSSDDARAIEKALLDRGCSGGSGGGDNSTKFVYAYLKTPTTEP